MRRRRDGFRSLIAAAGLALSATIGASRLHGQTAPRGGESHPLLVGLSIMNDRLDNHFDHRPVAFGVEADWVLLGGRALRGGMVSVTGRAHYYSNASILGDTPPYGVTSFAAGVAYHPIGDARLDPSVGLAVRSWRRTKSQSDSAGVDGMVDAGARLRVTRRLFVQTGMSLTRVDAFGLWRVALMFKF